MFMRTLALAGITTLVLTVACVAAEVYQNADWGFSIKAPEGWTITGQEEIMKAFEGRPDLAPDSLAAIRESNIIVNISQEAFKTDGSFNPNISISAKDIPLDTAVTSEAEAINFARQMAASSVPGNFDGGEPTNIERGGLKGARQMLGFQGPDGGLMTAGVEILVDPAAKRYYGVSYTYRAKKTGEKITAALGTLEFKK